MSFGWRTACLEEVCVRITDGAHASPPSVACGFPMASVKDMTPYGLNLKTARQISESDYQKLVRQGCKPIVGDVLIAKDGASALDTVCVVREDRDVVLLSSVAILRPNPSIVQSEFLRYFLDAAPTRAYMKAAFTTGAAIPRVVLKDLKRAVIQFPETAEQRRIASILSAYDDLIENNTRRIAILEEMARRIYEEWFVHFRFPGHEHARMVESELGPVPGGWVIQTLQSVCESKHGIQTGPFGSQLHKSDYTDEGIPVPMPKDLVGFRIETRGIARISTDTAERLSRHRMQAGDIVYGRRGDIGRRAYVMSDQAGWLCGTGCLRLRPSSRSINGWYLFNHLGQDSVAGLIAGRAHGVTMPNLNAKLMESVPVMCPPRELQDQFETATFPMIELRESLNQQNTNLRTTRDLLLPKLISGELDVSALPEPEAVAA